MVLFNGDVVEVVLESGVKFRAYVELGMDVDGNEDRDQQSDSITVRIEPMSQKRNPPPCLRQRRTATLAHTVGLGWSVEIDSFTEICGLMEGMRVACIGLVRGNSVLVARPE